MTDEKLIEWDHAFDLGVETIDNDHRSLVDLINELNDLIKNNAPTDQIHQLLDKAHSEMVIHFERENELIEKYVDKEEGERHIYFHNVTLDYIKDISNQYKEDPASVTASDLMHYLHGWIIDHIINQDHQMREYFERGGVVKSELTESNFFERNS